MNLSSRRCKSIFSRYNFGNDNFRVDDLNGFCLFSFRGVRMVCTTSTCSEYLGMMDRDSNSVTKFDALTRYIFVS